MPTSSRFATKPPPARKSAGAESDVRESSDAVSVIVAVENLRFRANDWAPDFGFATIVGIEGPAGSLVGRKNGEVVAPVRVKVAQRKPDDPGKSVGIPIPDGFPPHLLPNGYSKKVIPSMSTSDTKIGVALPIGTTVRLSVHVSAMASFPFKETIEGKPMIKLEPGCFYAVTGYFEQYFTSIFKLVAEKISPIAVTGLRDEDDLPLQMPSSVVATRLAARTIDLAKLRRLFALGNNISPGNGFSPFSFPTAYHPYSASPETNSDKVYQSLIPSDFFRTNNDTKTDLPRFDPRYFTLTRRDVPDLDADHAGDETAPAAETIKLLKDAGIDKLRGLIDEHGLAAAQLKITEFLIAAQEADKLPKVEPNKLLWGAMWACGITSTTTYIRNVDPMCIRENNILNLNVWKAVMPTLTPMLPVTFAASWAQSESDSRVKIDSIPELTSPLWQGDMAPVEQVRADHELPSAFSLQYIAKQPAIGVDFVEAARQLPALPIRLAKQLMVKYEGVRAPMPNPRADKQFEVINELPQKTFGAARNYTEPADDDNDSARYMHVVCPLVQPKTDPVAVSMYLFALCQQADAITAHEEKGDAAKADEAFVQFRTMLIPGKASTFKFPIEDVTDYADAFERGLALRPTEGLTSAEESCFVIRIALHKHAKSGKWVPISEYMALSPELQNPLISYVGLTPVAALQDCDARALVSRQLHEATLAFIDHACGRPAGDAADEPPAKAAKTETTATSSAAPADEAVADAVDAMLQNAGLATA